MTAASTPITVALLATPEATAATLYGFYDGLSCAGRDWQLLHGQDRSARCSGHWWSATTGGRSSPERRACHPDASFADCPRPDVG